MNFEKLIDESFKSAATNVLKLAENAQVKSQVAKAAELIAKMYVNQGCVYACGNGGSAGDAQNFVSEFVGRLRKDRTPLRAVALNADSSVLTALANDYGYENAYARQVEAMMKKGDVLLAITTSGNSENVIRAMDACRKLGGHTILLSGKDGGRAQGAADISILVPGEYAGPIQECHIIVYHALCQAVELALVEKGLVKYT